jgi:hypothetical protein
MIKLYIITCLFFIPVLQDTRWVRTNVNDEISLMLPKDFYAMTPEDIAQRYPSVRSPIGAYTNPDRVIDVSVKVSATQWGENDIELASKFFKSSIMNLYDQVNFTREELVEIDGKNYAVFEFDSRISGEEFALETTRAVRNYNYVQYVIHGGQTLVFSLQCPSPLRESCEAMGRRMMESIKLK